MRIFLLLLSQIVFVTTLSAQALIQSNNDKKMDSTAIILQNQLTKLSVSIEDIKTELVLLRKQDNLKNNIQQKDNSINNNIEVDFTFSYGSTLFYKGTNTIYINYDGMQIPLFAPFIGDVYNMGSNVLVPSKVKNISYTYGLLLMTGKSGEYNYLSYGNTDSSFTYSYRRSFYGGGITFGLNADKSIRFAKHFKVGIFSAPSIGYFAFANQLFLHTRESIWDTTNNVFVEDVQENEISNNTISNFGGHIRSGLLFDFGIFTIKPSVSFLVVGQKDNGALGLWGFDSSLGFNF